MGTRRIVERDVATDRVRLHVRETEGGERPLVLVHGNCSSSAFFDRGLASLPEEVYGVAPDLRGFGDTDPAPIDATRGMGDHADDLLALLDAEGLQRPPMLAHSAGAGAVMQLAVEHPDRVGPLVLEAPLSPYGFGGTKDAEGTPCFDDFAGSGGGAANPDFVAGLASGDRSDADPAAPRNVLRAFYVAEGYHFEDEEQLLDSMLTTRTGDDHYPGTAVQSPNWPGIAPGETGMNNAMSPRWYDTSGFALLGADGPSVRWVRGTDDAIVSDTSMLDLGQLGAIGAVPDWPGHEVFPPQPMVAQMRSVLERYAAAGGTYAEFALEGIGHSPHLEAPDTVLELALAAVRDEPLGR